MSKVFFICLLFVGSNCFAYFDVGLGYNFSSKNSLKQEVETRNFAGGQISYDWHDLNLGLELNFFSEKEAELGLASVSRSYADLTPWVRYNFVNTDVIDIFFGIGSGGYEEKIKINVSGASSYKEKSKVHWLLSGAMGVKAKFGLFSGVIEYRVSRRMAEEKQNQSLRLSTNLSF